ncbi:MAG: PDZ domain-containing protein [Elusimicrobia bacterium]|nr:PDZ domain-containing protein [Elusimicrobiota bacterium]
MKLTPLIAALLLAAGPAFAKRKVRPAPRAARKVASPVQVPVPVQVPAASSRVDAELAGFGASLDEDADGLLAADAWPGRPADAMGLKAGDRVWFVDRAAVRTRAEAAAARRAAAPEMRESLVVRRGLEAEALTGPESPVPPDFVRGSSDLSAREKVLSDARAARDSIRAKDAVAESAPLDWSLRSDQAFWIRFPSGLPADLAKDDVISAEVATGLTTDGLLDFLAVPPKSVVWARVVSAVDEGGVRTARLSFFKLRPAGGRTYPISGVATAVAGVPAADLVRVSAGGTLVAADPIPEADGKKRRGKDLLLDDAARLRVRLIEPATMAEAPSWWRAGPGLWLKTDADAQNRRRFRVTHLVSGRSAAAAGLKVGDLLDGIGGKSSERLEFEDAVDALYGAPGSAVKVSVVGANGSTKTLELARGMKYEGKGAAAPLPLPFEAR